MNLSSASYIYLVTAVLLASQPHSTTGLFHRATVDLPAYNQDKGFRPRCVFFCTVMDKNIRSGYWGKTRVGDIFSRVAELVLQPESLFLCGSVIEKFTHWSFYSLNRGGI